MRQFITLSLLALAIALAFAAPVMADGKLEWNSSSGRDAGGSGDWNGARTRADELGLTFGWMQDIQAQQNVKGGISKGGAVHSRATLRINYQFEPLTPLKGSEIQVSAAWNVGGNVNNNVGALLSPTGIYRETSIRLFQLYWGQFFADKQVHFKIGRLNVCNEMAYYPEYGGGDVGNGYYCNPGGMYLNQPFYAGTAWPIAAWGARIKIAPKKQDFEFWLGVYNGSQSDSQADGSEHGVDFKLNLFESTFVQGQFVYKLNQDPEDDGLPGNYKISGFYDSGSFARLDDATQTRRGNPGWYVIADQMLFRERPQATPTDPAKSKRGSKMSSPAPDQGLSAMANFIMHPRTTFNIAPYWVSAGLFYKGAIPHRDADQMSFAFYYAALSPDSQLEFEFQFRFYYSLQITPWFSMSPHVHYFRKPGGGQVANALVFGTFFHITL